MPARPKILVVESDPDLLIVLEKFLEDAGYETTITWDSWEALSWIDCNTFAAVIVGEHPQSVSCLEVVRRLRRKSDETVCVVLDGPECQLERDELRALAVRAVISKWNLKEVVQTLQATTRKTPGASSSAGQAERHRRDTGA